MTASSSLGALTNPTEGPLPAYRHVSRKRVSTPPLSHIPWVHASGSSPLVNAITVTALSTIHVANASVSLMGKIRVRTPDIILDTEVINESLSEH